MRMLEQYASNPNRPYLAVSMGRVGDFQHERTVDDDKRVAVDAAHPVWYSLPG
jgi:hypothetical protein